MPTTLDYVDQIIRVAGIATETDSTLDELHGLDTDLGLDYFDPVTRTRLAAVNIGENALEKLLSSLPLDDLQRIHALMYAGRDSNSAIDVKKEFSERGESRENMERSIAEKGPSLRTYFDKALEKAKKDRLNINAF